MAAMTEAPETFADQLLGFSIPSRHARGRAVRLLGTRAEQLVRAEDELLGLWSDDEQWRGAESAADRAAARFGAGAVRPAALLGGRARDRERLVDTEG